MLAKYWRLHARNNTDQTLTYNDGARISAIMSPWKFTSGAMAYGSDITDNTAFLTTDGTLAAAASTEGTVQDN